MSEKPGTLSSAGEALKISEEIQVLTKGYSMYPLFRPHRDITVIKRVDGKLKKGDVVLYPGANGDFILHRIMRIRHDCFVIRGDHNYFTEYVEKDKIVGILKEFYREGKYVNCKKSFKYKLYSLYIGHSYGLRFFWKKKLRPFLGKVKRFILGKRK